jgi:hypothetical protein
MNAKEIVLLPAMAVCCLLACAISLPLAAIVRGCKLLGAREPSAVTDRMFGVIWWLLEEAVPT